MRRWPKGEPLVPGRATLSLASSSPSFTVPSTVELHEPHEHKTSNTCTNRTAADQNTLRLNFLPTEPGTYTGELVCFSPLDVRCYELSGTAHAPGVRASLHFGGPARQPVVQELPIVNGTDSEWTIHASFRGASSFSGPAHIKVPAKATGRYPLRFVAEWLGESGTFCRQPTHFSHMSHPTFPISHILIRLRALSPQREYRRDVCL